MWQRRGRGAALLGMLAFLQWVWWLRRQCDGRTCDGKRPELSSGQGEEHFGLSGESAGVLGRAWGK